MLNQWYRCGFSIQSESFRLCRLAVLVDFEICGLNEEENVVAVKHMHADADASWEFFMIVKYFCLLFLIFKGTLFTLLLKVCSNSNAIIPSTVVFLVESIKTLVCLFVEYFTQEDRCVYKENTETIHEKSTHGLLGILKDAVYSSKSERFRVKLVLMISIPAFLYCVQGNLNFYAISHLNSLTFLVTSQLKIPMAAIFSRMMLGKRLLPIQWLSLGLLGIGVVLAQFSGTETHYEKSSSLMGFLALVLISISSGFSGVFFERTIKGYGRDRVGVYSPWMANLRLSLLGTFFSFLTMYWYDWEMIRKVGFFNGYSFVTVLMVFLMTSGDLSIAVVIRFSDNIVKGFANAISLVISLVFAYIFPSFRSKSSEEETPLLLFFGTALVTLATFIYNYPRCLGILGSN